MGSLVKVIDIWGYNPSVRKIGMVLGYDSHNFLYDVLTDDGVVKRKVFELEVISETG